LALEYYAKRDLLRGDMKIDFIEEYCKEKNLWLADEEVCLIFETKRKRRI